MTPYRMERPPIPEPPPPPISWEEYRDVFVGCLLLLGVIGVGVLFWTAERRNPCAESADAYVDVLDANGQHVFVERTVCLRFKKGRAP